MMSGGDASGTGKLEISFERDFFSSTEAMTCYHFTVETALPNDI